MDLKFLLNKSSKIDISLIVMSGESNSGGFAVNTDCSTIELAPRPSLKIFNPYTSLFETMQIGVNNMQDHDGFVDNSSHSWENGIANMSVDGTIKKQIHLVKTGHGGSTISQWNTGGSYSNKFNTRVASALATLKLTDAPKFALWYSQGINDRMGGGWNGATWQNATIARFNYLRNIYGDFPIVMTKFSYTYPDMDSLIESVCATVSNCYWISTGDLTRRDAYHWDYLGQKTIAARMVQKLKDQGYTI